jgi:hypothetical protein
MFFFSNFGLEGSVFAYFGFGARGEPESIP